MLLLLLLLLLFDGFSGSFLRFQLRHLLRRERYVIDVEMKVADFLWHDFYFVDVGRDEMLFDYSFLAVLIRGNASELTGSAFLVIYFKKKEFLVNFQYF